ncbi:MAG: hypothetical protein C4527_20060 [Candidatus Omnitrophota bacterium]|nr:MAG: hypothetical protein C4527_20060 [Candidatus Omnitrophota bacterium]
MIGASPLNHLESPAKRKNRRRFENDRSACDSRGDSWMGMEVRKQEQQKPQLRATIRSGNWSLHNCCVQWA